MADNITFKVGALSSLSDATKKAGQLLFAYDNISGSIYYDKDSSTRIKFNLDANKLLTTAITSPTEVDSFLENNVVKVARAAAAATTIGNDGILISSGYGSNGWGNQLWLNDSADGPRLMFRSKSSTTTWDNWSEIYTSSSISTDKTWRGWTADLSDTTVYDENTWYPIVGQAIPITGIHHLKCAVQLNSGSVPSWCNHTSGFTCNLEVLAIAGGWGTTYADTILLNNTYRYVSDNKYPVTWYQMTNSSRPVFYCRGGGKYMFYTDYPCVWTIHSSAFTESNLTVEPKTEQPIIYSYKMGKISANLNGTADYVYGTLTNPTSRTSYYIPFIGTSGTENGTKALGFNNGFAYRTIEGTTSTTGESILILGNSKSNTTAGNKSGFIRLMGPGENSYTELNTSITSGTNTVRFPAKSGYLLYKPGLGAIGSSSRPVYIDSTGEAIAISSLSLPGNISISSTSGGIKFEASNGTYSTYFGIGSGGENRGIYDSTLNRWIIYTDAAGKSWFNPGRIILPSTGGSWANFKTDKTIYQKMGTASTGYATPMLQTETPTGRYFVYGGHDNETQYGFYLFEKDSNEAAWKTYWDLTTGDLHHHKDIWATNFRGAFKGNADTATKLKTAVTLTVGSTGKSFDGSSGLSWTHAQIGATVSNAWTDGAAAGPKLTTTVNGVAAAAATIPIASTSVSGVVTNVAQTFAGNKLTTGQHIGLVSGGETDQFLDFAYASDPTAAKAPGASWRIGALNSGSGDTNYLVIQTGGSDTNATTWNNVIRLGMNTLDAGFGGNIYPLTNNSKSLGTSSLQWKDAWFSGTVTITKTTDAEGSVDNKPALIVGGLSTSQHLELDANELMSKSNGTTPTDLYLNANGGLVHVGAGGLQVDSGNILATSASGGTSDRSIRVTNANGSVGIYTSTNQGLYDFNKAEWIIYRLTGTSTTLVPAWGTKGSSSLPAYFSGGQPVACTAENVFSALSWTAGTTSGPVLNITVATKARTATIPSASVSASGIVTTGSQRFRGKKFFEYPAFTSNGSRYLGWHYYHHNGSTVVGEHWYDVGNDTNITAGRYYWRQYSPNSTANTTTTGYYENFMLPAVTVGRTGNASYEIFTSKSYSTLDGRYLKLSGGTMTGLITGKTENTSWIGTSHKGAFRTETAASGSSASAIISMKTNTGAWGIANLTGTDNLYFVFGTDANYSAGTNTTNNYYLTTSGYFSGSCASSNSCTGNAATATKLQTARTIFGHSFNGTSNVEGRVDCYGSYTATANERYRSCALEIRENGLVGNTQSDIGYAPSIGFHWGNRTAATLNYHSDGIFYFRKQDGTSRATIDANVNGRASSAGSATTATYLVEDESFNLSRHSFQYFNISGTAGAAVSTNDTPTTAWWHIQRHTHANSAGFYTDVAIPFNDNQIYYKRVANGSLANGGWVMLYDTKSIIYSSTEPTSGLKTGMIWLKPI